MSNLQLKNLNHLDFDYADFEVMSHGSLQTFSAAILISELLRHGIKTFLVSPGARAIPLILAINFFKKNPIEKSGATPELILVNDERAAAFMAQGSSKTGNIPCLICTSGTAVANYLPGVIESFYSKVPIIIISTDRPWELQNAGANQTIKQKDIFQDFTSFQLDLPALERDLNAHSFLSNIDQLVLAARLTSLPVHLNIGFKKPFYDGGFEVSRDLSLDDREVLCDWWQSEKPYRFIGFESSVGISKKDNIDLHTRFSGEKALIIAGPELDQEFSFNLLAEAGEKNIPILADIHSNLRQVESKNVLALYNLYLNDFVNGEMIPEVVFFVGNRMISDVLHKFLAKHKISIVRVSNLWKREDAIENEHLKIRELISKENFLRLLENFPIQKQEFSNVYYHLEDTARVRVSNALVNEEGSERAAICRILKIAPKKSSIFLSNSLIFREAENFSFEFSEGVRLYANRGATGIDGIIATALGTIIGDKSSLVCILGDQAAFHDLTSLGLVKNFKNPILIIIINNDGGSIFHLMKNSRLEDTLVNSHQRKFKNFVEGFGLTYFETSSVAKLGYIAEDVLQSKGQAVIEFSTNGEESVRKLANI